MIYYLYLLYLMCFCFFETAYMDPVFNTNLDGYIKKHTISTLKQILRSKRGFTKVNIEQIGQINRTLENASASLFASFNETYILLGNTISKIEISNKTLDLIPVASLDNIYKDQKILFTKILLFKNTYFILTRTETGESQIYRFSSKLYYIHSLYIPHSKDAHFFITKNKLYLIVANNKERNLAETSIYLWTGVLFNQIQTVYTTGAIRITSFSTKKAEIILILQAIPNGTVFTEVYEFSNKLRKIQILSTDHPIDIDTYDVVGETFVIIYEKSKNNTVYQWNGLQLVKKFLFQSSEQVTNSAISNIGHFSVLISTHLDKLDLLEVSQKYIKLMDEKVYTSNYSVIMDIHSRKKGKSITSIIVGMIDDYTVNIDIMNITIDIAKQDGKSEDTEPIRKCFQNLESKIYAVNRELNETEIISVNFDNPITILSQNLEKEPELEILVDDIQDRLNNNNGLLSNYTEHDEKNLVINGKVIFNGTLKSDEAIGNNVVIKHINSFEWTPKLFLKYKAPQTITGPSKIMSINTKILTISPEGGIFTDPLLKNGSQIIPNAVEIKNLRANSMHAVQINDVKIVNIYSINKPQRIKGKKMVHKLNSLKSKIQFINQQEPDTVIINFESRPPNMNFGTQVFIENLQVDNISGQLWDDFVDAVFKISDNQIINGSLNLSSLKTGNITMNTLRGIDVKDLMTTSTDQEIYSDIEFNRIYGENLNTNIVNGINLTKSAVTFDSPSTVKGAVTFEKLNVVKDLKLAGKFDESFFVKNGDHVLGTNESDLLQRYMRNVKIKGDLYLKNIVIQKPAKLFLSENEIDPLIRNVYWTKYTNQNITVHPTFNQGLKTPHILANTLNGIDCSRYMLNNNDPKLETDLQFDRIKIFGKVTLASDRHHQPDLKKFMKEVVTTNGSFLINGKKKYTNILKPENLATTTLNGINTLNILNTKWPANVTGTKIFKKLTIRENLHTAFADIDIINNVNVSEFLDKVVYIDEPQNLNLAHFKSVSATNLNVEKLNGHNYDDYNNSLEIMFSLDKVGDIYIDDNIVIDAMKDVSTINNISLLDLYNNANKSGVIKNNVGFSGKVKVNNLKTRSINDIDLKNITKRFLYRNYKNIIRAPYTFTNIKAGNIVTPKINNVSMDVVDISDESPIDIMNDVVFLSPIVLKTLNVNKMIPCSIDGLWKAVKEPSSQMWHRLNVTGNVMILDENSLLHKIIHKSVVKDSDNIITAPVKLANHMLTRNVHTKINLNNVNITAIFEDAVFTHSDTVQKITGVKSFPSITIGKAVVLKNTNVPFVNDENVTALDGDIVDKGNFDGIVIKGKKTFFGGLQTDRFNCKVISNIKPENIVQKNSRKKVPFATFDFVEVEEDLNLQMINNHNLSHILRNRLLINSPNLQMTNAVYYFENLDVQNISTPSINDYKMIDVVFDNHQNITGQKRFMHDIEIFGNLQTDIVNGFELENEYEKSLPSDENVNINGSVTLLDPVQIFGRINATYLNSYPISNIKEILADHDKKVEIVKLTAEYGIIDQLRRNVLIAEDLPVKYIYLEKSDVLQMSVTNTISASTMSSNGYVLIHLIGEESGEHCGLPKICKCPVQYTMEISPKHSVNEFINKGTQRVFSYDDDSMIIHFITNTVSTDSVCRTNTTKEMNEMSVMNWNTRPSNNTIGSFHQYIQPIMGYISKVNFFTVNGKTYVIIGKYYDPVLDSHDLECIVLKFDERKTTAKEIQRIRTKALWQIYLFYTAQGVVLILGKKNNNNYDEEETEIYRFHEETEKFLYLRRVPFIGCTDATGVVLGVDSFIIVAQKFGGIYILKYYPEFDNYYFYQRFDELMGTVLSVSSFYSADFGISDAFLCVVTTDDNFFVYSFKYSAGWKLESNGKLEELRDLVPFKLKDQSYLFAASGKTSSLLTVVTNEST